MQIRPTKRFSRTLLIVLVALATLIPVVANAAAGFDDVEDTSVFVADIQWMSDNEITKGCNPPTNTNYCPSDNVSREQMAAFMHRLADSQAVDAGTLEGLAAADLVQHGTIETTMGGTAWLPHGTAPTTVSRTSITTSVSGNGMMVISLDGPASIGGVDYGLESVEMCLQRYGGSAVVNLVTAQRQNDDGTSTTVLSDNTERSATGCYTYTVGSPAGIGISLLARTAGPAGNNIRLGAVKATWTTDAAN